MQNYRLSRQGFTLVELSIVLVVIGLLIGGILVGQSLIESAKVRSAIKQVEQYSIAVSLYKERFRALPGDDPRAFQRWGAACLGHTGLYIATISRCTYGVWGNSQGGDGKIDCTENLPQKECTLFWRHLEMASMIPHPQNIYNGYTGIIHSGYPVSGTVAAHPAGYSAPKLDAYKKGIVTIAYSSTISPYTAVHNKNAFILGADDGVTLWNSELGIIPIASAASIDQKIDDGNPTMGKVATKGSSWGPNGSGSWAVTAANYAINNANARYNFAGQYVNLYIFQDW